jgi:transposase-like protein
MKALTLKELAGRYPASLPTLRKWLRELNVKYKRETARNKPNTYFLTEEQELEIGFSAHNLEAKRFAVSQALKPRTLDLSSLEAQVERFRQKANRLFGTRGWSLTITPADVQFNYKKPEKEQ